MQNNDQKSYSLYAQNRDGTILIKNNQQNNFIQTTPGKVLANPILRKGLSANDLKIIRCIAESQPKLRKTK